MYKRSIQRLTLTYLTLSLQDIADAVQLSTPKEAEMHILQMVSEYSQSINFHSATDYSLFCHLNCTADIPFYLAMNFRSKMVRYLRALTRRMAWLVSWRILNSIKAVRWLSTLTPQFRGNNSFDDVCSLECASAIFSSLRYPVQSLAWNRDFCRKRKASRIDCHMFVISGWWHFQRSWHPWMSSCHVILCTCQRWGRSLKTSKRLIAAFKERGSIYITQGLVCLPQVGRERQKFDMDDFDTVPQKFPMWMTTRPSEHDNVLLHLKSEQYLWTVGWLCRVIFIFKWQGAMSLSWTDVY